MSASIPDPDATLDAEIQRVRDEISRLTSRKRALVSATLSTAPLTTTLKATATRSERTALDSLITSQLHANEIHGHRLLTGISVFDPGAPDADQLHYTNTNTNLATAAAAAAANANKPSGSSGPPIQKRSGRKEAVALETNAGFCAPFRGRRDVLGLRFERYSRAKRAFAEPACVVLELDESDVDEDGDEDEEDEEQRAKPVLERSAAAIQRCVWRVAKHDLPSWIPVEQFATRYLARNADERVVDGERGLGPFVRAVQGELAAGLRRLDAVEMLEGALPGGWREVALGSTDGREVRVEWVDGRMGRILVDGEGRIERVVATDPSGKRDGITEGEILRKGHILALCGNEKTND